MCDRPDISEVFFEKTISYFEQNKNVASVTTQIYDEMLRCDRDVDKSNKIIDSYHCIFKYLGGSHFLRRSIFCSPLYFDISYGSEEYAPSIIVQDRGYYNVFDEDIRVIHRPKINKWIQGSIELRFIQIRGAAVVYATKKILYPSIFRPLLFAGYKMRCHKYLSEYSGASKEADDMVKRIVEENRTGKIKVKTVLSMFLTFGPTVF